MRRIDGIIFYYEIKNATGIRCNLYLQPFLVAFFIAFFQRGGGGVGYKNKFPEASRMWNVFLGYWLEGGDPNISELSVKQ